MAKVVQSQQQIVVEPWWGTYKVIFIGLGFGLVWWALASLLKQFVIDPIACRDLSTASACINSFGVAGSIATVVVGIAGLLVLIRALQPRPIIIALAPAILLWDLGALLNGLVWWEVALWGIFFYGISYSLFWLVARINHTLLSLGTAAVIVLIIRLLLVL